MRTKAKVEKPPGNGARTMMSLTVAMGPYRGVNHNRNEFRKSKALQIDALNGTGDNWEVLYEIKINICCFELDRPRSQRVELGLEHQDSE